MENYDCEQKGIILWSDPNEEHQEMSDTLIGKTEVAVGVIPSWMKLCYRTKRFPVNSVSNIEGHLNLVKCI